MHKSNFFWGQRRMAGSALVSITQHSEHSLQRLEAAVGSLQSSNAEEISLLNSPEQGWMQNQDLSRTYGSNNDRTRITSSPGFLSAHNIPTVSGPAWAVHHHQPFWARSVQCFSVCVRGVDSYAPLDDSASTWMKLKSQSVIGLLHFALQSPRKGSRRPVWRNAPIRRSSPVMLTGAAVFSMPSTCRPHRLSNQSYLVPLRT